MKPRGADTGAPRDRVSVGGHDSSPRRARLGMTVSGRRGFTLVEILVAVIVMSIALIVLITCFTGALGVQRKVRSHAIAQNAAQSKLDSLRNGEYANLTFGDTFQSVSGLTNGLMRTRVTLAAPASLAQIQVDIWWGTLYSTTENRHLRGHVTYVTYLAEPMT